MCAWTHCQFALILHRYMPRHRPSNGSSFCASRTCECIADLSFLLRSHQCFHVARRDKPLGATCWAVALGPGELALLDPERNRSSAAVEGVGYLLFGEPLGGHRTPAFLSNSSTSSQTPSMSIACGWRNAARTFPRSISAISFAESILSHSAITAW